MSVTAGSFEIDGVTIQVAANDSIQSVLDKITNSSAGITASFDTLTETVLLTRNETGSTPIVVGNDDSGFLSAVKLDDGILELGTAGGDGETIGSIPALSQISTGTFSINGVEIQVDVLTDSVDDVIDRINAADAGAFARYDAAREAFVVMARGSQTPLVLSDGSSGFFSGVDIQAGAYEPSARARSGLRRDDANEVRRLLGELGRSVSGLFGARFGGSDGSSARIEAKVARSLIDTAISGSFESFLEVSGGGVLRSGLGLDLVRGDGTPRLELDVHRFGEAASSDAEELLRFLVGEEQDGPGLLVALSGAVDKIAERLLERFSDEELVGLRLNLAG